MVVVVVTAGTALVLLRIYNNLPGVVAPATAVQSWQQGAAVLGALCAAVFAVITALQTFRTASLTGALSGAVSGALAGSSTLPPTHTPTTTYGGPAALASGKP